MSLVTTDPNLLYAQDDIVAYKVLEKTSEGKFVSPFWYFEWELGELYIDDCVLERYTFPEPFRVAVEKGMFHSCATQEGAYTLKDSLDMLYEREHMYVVAECIIPKGSEVIYGKSTGTYADSLCSKQLKITKIYDK